MGVMAEVGGAPRAPPGHHAHKTPCSQEGVGGQLWFPWGCEHNRLDRPKQSPDPLCWVPGLVESVGSTQSQHGTPKTH